MESELDQAQAQLQSLEQAHRLHDREMSSTQKITEPVATTIDEVNMKIGLKKYFRLPVDLWVRMSDFQLNARYIPVIITSITAGRKGYTMRAWGYFDQDTNTYSIFNQCEAPSSLQSSFIRLIHSRQFDTIGYMTGGINLRMNEPITLTRDQYQHYKYLLALVDNTITPREIETIRPGLVNIVYEPLYKIFEDHLKDEFPAMWAELYYDYIIQVITAYDGAGYYNDYIDFIHSIAQTFKDKHPAAYAKEYAFWEETLMYDEYDQDLLEFIVDQTLTELYSVQSENDFRSFEQPPWEFQAPFYYQYLFSVYTQYNELKDNTIEHDFLQKIRELVNRQEQRINLIEPDRQSSPELTRLGRTMLTQLYTLGAKRGWDHILNLPQCPQECPRHTQEPLCDLYTGFMNRRFNEENLQ